MTPIGKEPHESTERARLLRVRPAVGSAPPAVSEYPVWKAVWRRWWVILLFAFIGGALGVAYANRQPVEYQAQSVIVVTRSKIPREDISSILDTVFPTDPVIKPIISELDLQTTSHALLSSGTLAGNSESGGSLVITAKDESPNQAQELANAAAESFSSVGDEEGLGKFAVLEASDSLPTDSRAPRQLLVIGLGLGGAIGVSLMIGLLFLRQPILTESEAADQLDANESLSAYVHLPLLSRLKRTPSGGWGTARVFPREISSAALHAAADDSDRSAWVCCIVLDRNGPRGGGRRRERYGVLKRWHGFHSASRGVEGGQGTGSSQNWKTNRAHRALLTQMGAEPYSALAEDTPSDRSPAVWINSYDPRLTKAAMASAGLVILVPSGCRRGSLQALAEELYTSAKRTRRVAVFVKTKRTLA